MRYLTSKILLSLITFLNVTVLASNVASLNLRIDKEYFSLKKANDKEFYTLEWIRFDAKTEEAFAYMFSKECKVDVKGTQKNQFRLSCVIENQANLEAICTSNTKNKNFPYECKSSGDVLDTEMARHIQLDSQEASGSDDVSGGGSGNPDRRTIHKDEKEYEFAREANQIKAEEELLLSKQEQQAHVQEQTVKEEEILQQASTAGLASSIIKGFAATLWNYAPYVIGGTALIAGAVLSSPVAMTAAAVAGGAVMFQEETKEISSAAQYLYNAWNE